MADKKKISGNIIGFFVIALIFYFLGRHLYLSWEQIKSYDFSLNYFYLVLSFLFFVAGFLGRGLPWWRIVNILQPDNDVTYREAIKFHVFALLGKYLPGKVFAAVGKIYFARDKNISKKNLYLSVILDNIFAITALFLLALFFVGFLDQPFDFFRYYGIGLAGIAILIITVHPRPLRYAAGLFQKLLHKEHVDMDFHLSGFHRSKIISYYILVESIIGLGFFWLVSSVTPVGLENIFAVVGAYVLAQVFGVLALFAPGGLGVREGILVLLMGAYLPASVAILISLLARVWTTLAEVFLVGGFYLFYKIKK